MRAMLIVAAVAVLIVAGCSESTDPPVPGQKGVIIVTVAPAELVAGWTVSGPDQYEHDGTGSETLTDLDEGSYTVAWDELPGYLTPAGTGASLAYGDTVHFSGTYVLDPTATGSVSIDVFPDFLNPAWVLKVQTGGGLHDASGTGDALVDDIPPGPLTIDWQPLPDWYEPHGGQYDHDLQPGQALQVTGQYEPRPELEIELVPVSAGAFVMGSPEWEMGYDPPFFTDPLRPDHEGPQHEVTLTRDLLVSIHEITRAQYESVTGTDPTFFSGSPNLPVETVTWLQALQFCNALSAAEGLTAAYEIVGFTASWDPDADGYRLPTEAEWEYLCRGERPEAFCFGEFTVLGEGLDPARDPVLDRVGWYWSNTGGFSTGMPLPVGSKLPNAYGLYDMHGNVDEWVWDRYDPDYYSESPLVDPQGPAVGNERVLRGGSYASYAQGCRSASRAHLDPTVGTRSVGFRVVRNAESTR